VVQAILQKLYDAGEIYFGEYGGWYCYGCERFYTEKEIVDGKCPDHQTSLTFIKEKNYFFKMSKYQEWLIKHLEDHPGFIQPERYRNEVLGFLREPLQDLSISRPKARLQWGIPLPFDDQYVTYVWFDALINYVSALGYPDGALYKELWAAGHAEHLIGKDILKPHGVYWPTMLHAAGIPLYRRLNVHGYWTIGGGKMSKSIGNVVEAFQLTDKYGHDAFRYFLLREMTFGLDASFSEEAFVGRLNADLANDLGNLASRATTMIVNFGGGRVPRPEPETPADTALRSALEQAARGVDEAMEDFAFQKASRRHLGVSRLWSTATSIPRRPWALAKDPGPARETGHRALHARRVAPRHQHLIDPFLPDAAAKIRAAVGAGSPRLSDLGWGGLPPGTPVQKVSALFPRIESEKSLSPQGRGQGEGSAVDVVDQREDCHRRLQEGRAPRGRGAGGRARAEVQEAPQAHGEGGERSAPSWPASPSTTRRSRWWAARSWWSPISSPRLSWASSPTEWCWPPRRRAPLSLLSLDKDLPAGRQGQLVRRDVLRETLRLFVRPPPSLHR
jgi:methionyl-tRNA synthetase